MPKREMKNSTFILWAIIILVLIGFFLLMTFIPKGEKIPPKQISTNLHKSFDAQATIKMKDLIMEADINKTDIGACTIKVKEPKTLKGMEFQYNGNDIVVSYRGLSVKLDENSKLVSSVAAAIVNSIDTAASPSGIHVEMEKGALILTGDSDSGEFKIVLDKKTGNMLSLDIPQLDLECNFDNFIFS